MQDTMTRTTDQHPEGASGWIISCNCAVVITPTWEVTRSQVQHGLRIWNRHTIEQKTSICTRTQAPSLAVNIDAPVSIRDDEREGSADSRNVGGQTEYDF
jgi:hypothetical protein